MKRFVLVLFSLLIIWTQSPLVLRPVTAAAGEAACKCCCACGGTCGCVAPGQPNSHPLPAATPSLSLQTELLLMAAPATSLALPLGAPAENLFPAPNSVADLGVPLYRRDCALLL